MYGPIADSDSFQSRSLVQAWFVGAHAVTVVGSSISTPTIYRIFCNNILECFGFPKIDPASVNNIMNKIIGWNLYGFLAQQITQSLTVGTGVAILGIFSLGGALPLAAGLSMLEVPTAGRIIVKCACDLILILDRAFKHGGKFVTSQDIELACWEYVATTVQGGWSKRRQVHAQVTGLIPIVSRKFWTGVRISIIKVGMEEIIENNRWSPSDAATRTDSALDLVTKWSLDSVRDENELENLFVHHKPNCSCAVQSKMKQKSRQFHHDILRTHRYWTNNLGFHSEIVNEDPSD